VAETNRVTAGDEKMEKPSKKRSSVEKMSSVEKRSSVAAEHSSKRKSTLAVEEKKDEKFEVGYYVASATKKNTVYNVTQ